MATPNSPTTTLGQRLEASRQALPKPPSFRQVERKLFSMIGEFAPSSETLRRWHRPDTEESEVNPFILLAIADVYGTTLRNLSENGANMLSDLGERSTGWLIANPIAA